MVLVLTTVVVFIVTGLASRRFDWRQQAFIVAVAAALAAVQFAFPRFL